MTTCIPLEVYCECGKKYFIDGRILVEDFLDVIDCKCGRDINDKCKEVLKDFNEFKEIMNELYNSLDDDELLNKLWDLYMKNIVGSINDI